MTLRGEIFRDSDYKIRSNKHVSNGMIKDYAINKHAQTIVNVRYLRDIAQLVFNIIFYLRFNYFNTLVLILYEHTKLNCNMTNQIYD